MKIWFPALPGSQDHEYDAASAESDAHHEDEAPSKG